MTSTQEKTISQLPTDSNVVKGGLTLPPKPSGKRKTNSSRLASDVWDHFTKVEGGDLEFPRASCNYCKVTYACDSKKNGTTNMRNHLGKCKKYVSERDSKQKVLHFEQKEVGGKEGSLVATSFSQEHCRKMLAMMVILSELPFIFAESESFIKFCKALQPKFVIPSRITVAKDCYMLYMEERKKLKGVFTKGGQRVCLTTDTWTSVQNINYMVLTAHFIDNDWNLHKRILNFCPITNHKGETIGRAIEKCLQGWGIDKLFTLTVDNASSNDTAIAYLVRKFKGKNGVVLNGEFVHVRCSAHILNLIVGDALKDMRESLVRIRSAIKYVRSSPSRSQTFKDLAKEDDISTKSSLCLDVPTRWNSTYLMLESAIKFQKTFERLEEQDTGYLVEGIPSSEDWDNSRVFVQFLKTFYEVTLKVSASLQVTSNIYFTQLIVVQEIIHEYSLSHDSLLMSMAKSMQAKFDKYWGGSERTNFLLYVAVVLDPRFKLKYVKYCLSELFKEDVAALITNKIEQTLRRLCDEYFLIAPKENTCQTTQDMDMESETSVLSNDSSGSFCAKLTAKFKKIVDREIPNNGNTEVDRYLEESCQKDYDDFSVLTWWKVNASRFKILGMISKDVFAIPISTVASESAFSTGGRVLDHFRSTLSPKTVETLICGQNWFRSKPIILHYNEEIIDADQIDNEYTSMECAAESGLDETNITTT